MITKQAAILSIPPVAIMLSFLIGLIAQSLGSDAFLYVHFELEMVIFWGAIASAIVLIRHFPKWRDKNLVLPLILNGLVVGLFILALLLYAYRQLT